MEITLNITQIPEIKEIEIETVDYWIVAWEAPYRLGYHTTYETKKELFLTEEKAKEYAEVLQKAFEIVGCKYFKKQVEISKGKKEC